MRPGRPATVDDESGPHGIAIGLEPPGEDGRTVAAVGTAPHDNVIAMGVPSHIRTLLVASVIHVDDHFTADCLAWVRCVGLRRRYDQRYHRKTRENAG